MNMHELHRRALEAARKFFQIEAELLELIQKIDACKGFRDLGHASLFSYVVGGLKLSESVALNLINVARKAVQVPALKTEIAQGGLSVCKARKIVPVLNAQNHAEWIEKAKMLPARQLEREIAKVAPTEAFPERVRYATENRLNLSLSVDEKTMQAIRRVQDLECQRQGRPVSLEETLAAMAGFYLEKNDPVEKAKRVLRRSKAHVVKGEAHAAGDSILTTKAGVVRGVDSAMKAAPERSDVTVTDYACQWREIAGYEPKPVQGAKVVLVPKAAHASKTAHAPKARTSNRNGSGQMGGAASGFRKPIPAATEHAVMRRDDGQCTAVNPGGLRCGNRRWIHIHHRTPVSSGGQNIFENLTTLCSAHHKLEHAGRAP